MRTIGLAAMVKTPGLSPVKTRLAKTLGDERALAIYCRCLELTEKLLLDAQTTLSIKSYWAVAEREALDHEKWKKLSRVCQGGGGLGDRLDTVYRTLMGSHSAALIIGADSPLLALDHLVTAQNALQKESKMAPWVVGPTVDGGFYLFGGKTLLPEGFWNRITYSVDTTLKELFAALPPGSATLNLAELDDIDTEADLERIIEANPTLFE